MTYPVCCAAVPDRMRGTRRTRRTTCSACSSTRAAGSARPPRRRCPSCTRLLREVPDLDRRLSYFGRWRLFDTDEAIRAGVGELLAATG
jgi:hypothetical protein